MPLYGHEMDEEITPLQAGLNWAIKFDKPDFVGKGALEAQRDADDYARIAGLIMEGRGSWGPSVAKNIATALVAPPAAAEGTPLDVEIRGTHHPARTTALPFYRRPKA